MFRFATAFALLTATPLMAETPPMVLTQVDGSAPGYDATLALDRPGFVRGRAPCNSYSARQTATLPDFKAEQVVSTKVACPDLSAEQRFFDLLRQMDRAEPTAEGLTLTGAGHRMVFSRLP